MLPTPAHHPWMTEDIAALREAVRRFSEQELTPHRARWVEQGHVDRAVWRQVAEMGMLLPELPEAYGGIDGNAAHQFVCQEEMTACEVLPSFGTSVHTIVAHYILDCGTEAQKRAWLPKLASGEWIGAIAMTEPGAGSDLQGIQTRARREGNEYIINGAKTFITNGHMADFILVVAKTDLNAGARGVSLLAVETHELAGFRRGRVLDKVGMRGSDTAELFFDEVRVPVANLLGGEEGRGFYQLMQQLPYERLLIAVAAVATMERAVKLTVEYTQERRAFKQAIFDFQNTRFKLAECATTAHIARCYLNDCIQRYLDGSLDPNAAYMAKWWLTEQQSQLLDTCLQLHGGYGYMNEYPIARMWADARVAQIFGGSNEIMKELIARSLDKR
ncbi:acyl-CoA dehydrogenase family protein [Parachitinimonas caeni]|uniref:Acyl-CoA dehydrogenase family protein n=1 Tax=Parachitinimonas caeni TaxID=3031301 RepID=A0ABT7DRY4_9NEIS|nr:acyl-CoA dehydrogenase family protein [Parachitinimonas caeni]MDK2122824.1 acyl-CoA dehydrogenase family protein [Parachitinimonas caeni]